MRSSLKYKEELKRKSNNNIITGVVVNNNSSGRDELQAERKVSKK